MQDIEYLKSMYPSGIKILQGYVSEACDRLDYKNSPMYDEYPDHLMVNRLCDTICDTVMSSEGAERVTSMWNIAETDRSSLEMEELHNDMKRLDIDSSVDNPDADQDEMIPEECFQIEVESVRKNQGMQYMDKQEANEVTPDPAQGRGESTIRSVEERIETQEIRGRNPMGPGPERPPMGPGPGRPPMGPGPERPPMGPGPERPPMGPESGRPPMGPGPDRPPQGPGSGRPPMGPGPERPPMGPGPGRPPMGPESGRPPMGPGQGRPPMGPGPERPPMGPGPGRPPMGPGPERPPMGPGQGRPPMGPGPERPPRPVPPPPRPPQPPRPVPPPPRPPQPPRPVPPPPRPPRPVPPPKPVYRPSWLRDLIKVLLLNEMHNRRCARGICFI